MSKQKESKVVSENKKTKSRDLSIKKIVSKKADNPVKKIELKIIKPENYFFLHDGKVLKDLFELVENLENMPNDIFSYHVTESKNDFSNWIKDIFENKDLAEEIYMIKEPKQVQLVILKHIAKNKRG